jgi:hypothetical protein
MQQFTWPRSRNKKVFIWRWFWQFWLIHPHYGMGDGDYWFVSECVGFVHIHYWIVVQGWWVEVGCRKVCTWLTDPRGYRRYQPTGNGRDTRTRYLSWQSFGHDITRSWVQIPLWSRFSTTHSQTSRIYHLRYLTIDYKLGCVHFITVKLLIHWIIQKCSQFSNRVDFSVFLS